MENIKKIKFKLFICCLSFFVVYIGIAFSMFVIKPTQKVNKQTNFKINDKKSKKRGNIYDNNGYLIATTIRKYDLVVNPSILREPRKFELELKKIFGNETNFNFKDRLSSIVFKILFAFIPSNFIFPIIGFSSTIIVRRLLCTCC